MKKVKPLKRRPGQKSGKQVQKESSLMKGKGPEREYNLFYRGNP
jgi:hypothetical protein